MLIVFRNLLLVCEAFLQTSYPLKKLGSGQCEVLGKSRSLLGFQREHLTYAISINTYGQKNKTLNFIELYQKKK
jgi:hypothetical protein